MENSKPILPWWLGFLACCVGLAVMVIIMAGCQTSLTKNLETRTDPATGTITEYQQTTKDFNTIGRQFKKSSISNQQRADNSWAVSINTEGSQENEVVPGQLVTVFGQIAGIAIEGIVANLPSILDAWQQHTAAAPDDTGDLTADQLRAILERLRNGAVVPGQ